jgi:hypothetical protein
MVVGYGMAKGTDVVAPFPSMSILKPAADDHWHHRRPNDRPTTTAEDATTLR